MRRDSDNILKKIVDEYPDEVLMKANGFDKAVIGVDINSYRLVYSFKKCLRILMEDMDMEYDDALEYFYINISGAYVGEHTPIWVNDNF